MFALLISSKEKTILKVLLKKIKPNCWVKIYLVYHYCIFRTQWMDFDSFRYKTSCSTVNPNFFLRGPACSISWTHLVLIKASNSRCVCDKNARQSQHLSSLGKNKQKNQRKKLRSRRSDPIALKIFSDQTNVRLNPPLIRPTQTEVTSDHTIVRSNQIPDPVILVWEHTVCVGLGLIRGHVRMEPQPGYKCSKA